MAVPTQAIKALRERTGAGIMDSKRALEESNGDIEQAEKLLATRGVDIAAKKMGRTAEQGLIEVYVHTGGRMGAIRFPVGRNLDTGGEKGWRSTNTNGQCQAW